MTGIAISCYKSCLRYFLFVSVALYIFSPNPVFCQDFTQLKEVNGLVKVQAPGQNLWTKAQINQKILKGSKIKTFLESSAILVYPDGSLFTLGENSFLEINDMSQNSQTKATSTDFKLNVGTLHYKITPIKDKASQFKIHSATAIVGVTGTQGLMRSNGQDKPTENILIEGTTYNTDAAGRFGMPQKPGGIYKIDGTPDLYNADAQKEANLQLQVNEEVKSRLKELVLAYEDKKKLGFLIKDLDKIIEDIFAAIEEKDYPKAKRLLDKGFAQLDKAKQSDELSEFQQGISKIIEKIKIKEKEGFDVKELYLIIAQIEEVLEKLDFNTARNLVALIQQKFDSLPKAVDDFLSSFEKLQTLTLEKEAQGFTVSEIKEILRMALTYYQNQDFAQGYKMLNVANDKLQLVLKDLPLYLEEKLNFIEKEILAKQQEGFDVQKLSNILDQARKLFASQSYFKLKELLEQAEAEKLTLKKIVSLEWQLKLSELEKDIEYKKSLGFDLISVYDDLRLLSQYVDASDLVGIEKIYEVIKNKLKDLGLPAGLAADWNKFLADLKEKEEQGYNVLDLKDLQNRILASFDKGDLNLARELLEKAKQKLLDLTDSQPPNIQIISFEQTPEQILVKGLATDNIKVKSILIDNSSVEFANNGEFTYQTVTSPLAEFITIVAIDSTGNLSPEIKLKIKPGANLTQGKLTDVVINYNKEELLISGGFIPAGKVTVNQLLLRCDAAGKFQAQLLPTIEVINQPIVVKAFDFNDAEVDQITLKVEDKIAPQIIINKVDFIDNLAPVLTVNPLVYQDDKVIISGIAQEQLMATVTGVVTDLGLGVDKLIARGSNVSFDTKGNFSFSFSLMATKPETNIVISAEDKTGNLAEINVPLDNVISAAIVLINDEEIPVDSKGEFSKLLPLTRQLKSVKIVAKDFQGNLSTAQEFPLANIFPPILEISSVVYTNDEVEISGQSSPEAEIEDKTKQLFAQPVKANASGLFNIKLPRPKQELVAVLVAYDLEKRLSSEVSLTIKPLIDVTPPRLYVSEPILNGNSLIVEGLVEDDTQIESLSIAKNKVKTENGRFYYEIFIEPDTSSIEIIARDIFGKETKEILVVKDSEFPKITINVLEAKDGKLNVEGIALDNIGVKGVWLNNIPIDTTVGKEIKFSYTTALTADFKEITISAVDIYGNVTSEGPRPLAIAEDKQPPIVNDINYEYEGLSAYVSGLVQDPSGVKAVYINGKASDVSSQGSFKTKVDIMVDSLGIETAAPEYDKGKLIIKGKIAEISVNPGEIIVEAEDLWGNKSAPVIVKASPYKKSDIKISIQGQEIIPNENGEFNLELAMQQGMKNITIEATDPFGNSTASALDLETTPPALTVNDLQYTQDDSVTVSGTAEDQGSGLAAIVINGVNVEFDSSGRFTRKFSITEGTLSINVLDYLGNLTAITKDIIVPDIYPPRFVLDIKPIPAIIGKPVNITINSYDSHSKLPESLGEKPEVTAITGEKKLALAVDGQDSQFIASLNTEGLPSGLYTIVIEGKDKAGNFSNQSEGVNQFALTDQDVVSPSFSIVTNPSPLILDQDNQIKIFASETLKTIPQLDVQLPGGETKKLNLSKDNDKEFTATIKIGVESGLGEVILRVTGGEDAAGNLALTTEKKVNVVTLQKTAELPLNIDFIEFSRGQFTIRGATASEALVRIEFMKLTQDVLADKQGRFSYQTFLDPLFFKELAKIGQKPQVKVKAKNYAGFESAEKTIEVNLPQISEDKDQNFTIDIKPSRVEPGKTLDIAVEVVKGIAEKLSAVIYLPSGKTQIINFNLTGKTFKGQYLVPQDTPPGPAMLEVSSGVNRQNSYFEVLPAQQLLALMKKEDIYSIMAMPDPIIKGKEIEFKVNSKIILDKIPTLFLLLPGGQRVSISLSGSKQEFRGRFLCPAQTPQGMAELILGLPNGEEMRRPIGVWDETRQNQTGQVYLATNPSPLVSGSGFDVKTAFSTNINFTPRLDLRLPSGNIVTIDLKGKTPGNKFDGRFNLPADNQIGLATFIIKDDSNSVLDSFPTQIIPMFGGKSGFDIMVIPETLKRMNVATVRINSSTVFLPREKLEAHITYSDARKYIIPVNLNDAKSATGYFNVPADAPLGIVIIEVFKDGVSCGTTRAQVVDDRRDITTGGGRISISPYDFAPRQKVRVNFDSDSTLFSLPKAEFNFDKGNFPILLKGNIPGNRFEGEFIAPQEEFNRAVIQVRDDRNNPIAILEIDRQEKSGGRIIVEPMPPMFGRPLTIRYLAPGVLNFLPRARLITSQGPQELKLIGAVPSDTFSGVLPSLQSQLNFVEILNKEGIIIAGMPIDQSKGVWEFEIEPLMTPTPGGPMAVILKSNIDVPFVPLLRLDFSGIIVDVPLQGAPFSRSFSGRFTVPVDANLTANIMATVADPGPGKPILWQRSLAGTDQPYNGNFVLNVKPIGSDSVELYWDRINQAFVYELNYGEGNNLVNKLEVKGDSRYVLKGLTPGKNYSFKIVALDIKKQVIIQSLVVSTIVGETNNLLPGQFKLRVIFIDGSTQEFNLPNVPQAFMASASPRTNIMPYSGLVMQLTPPPITDLPIMVTSSPAVGSQGQTYIIEIFGNKFVLNKVPVSLELFLNGALIITKPISPIFSPRPNLGGRINIIPYPPAIGQSLNVQANLDNPAPAKMKGELDFFDGTKYSFDFPQSAGQTSYYTNLAANVINKNVQRVRVWDETNQINIVLEVGSPIPMPSPSGTELIFMPYPPQRGQDVNVEARLSSMAVMAKLVFKYDTQTISEEFVFPASPDGMNFKMFIPGSRITGNPIGARLFADGQLKLEMPINPAPTSGLPYKAILIYCDGSNKELVFPPLSAGADTSWSGLFLNPDPLIPGQSLEVKTGSSYKVTFSPSDTQKCIQRIRIVDIQVNDLPSPRELGPGNLMVNITTVNPDPPMGNQNLYIKAEFLNNNRPPFKPRVAIEFDNNQSRVFPFNQDAGNLIYDITVPSNEIIYSVRRVSVESDTGMYIPQDRTWGLQDPCPCLDITTDPATPVAGQELTVYLNFCALCPFVPTVEILFTTGEASARKTPTNSQNVGRDYYEFKFSASEMKSSVKRIIAYRGNGSECNRRDYYNPTLTPPTRFWIIYVGNGEVKVGWDPVTGAGVAGYNIYYGRASKSYTESGSPFRVDGEYTSSAVIRGLTNGVTYYFNITSFRGVNINEETEVSRNEPLATPSVSGGGGGIGTDDIGVTVPGQSDPQPSLKFENVNPGSNTTSKSMTVTNLSSSRQTNIKIKTYNLFNTADSTQISGSNINVSSAAFLLSASSSQSVDVYISVPASGITPGEYRGQLNVYNDLNGNNDFDQGEFPHIVNIYMFFGAAGLEVTTSEINLGENIAGASSLWQSFGIKNTSAATLNQLKARLPVNVVKFATPGGGAFTPASGFTAEYSLPSSISAGITDNGSMKITVPSNAVTGEYGGSLTFYNDSDNDNTIDATEPLDALYFHFMVVASGASSSVDHIEITTSAGTAGSASGVMGTPVLVRIRAMYSSNAVVLNYNSPVTISISESSDKILNSALVSVRDRVSGTTSSVEMYQGIGYFTVDTLEPETITVNTTSIASNGALAITFSGRVSGSAATQIAVQGPTYVKTGTAASDGALIWVSALDASGRVVTNYGQTVSRAVTISYTDPATASTTLSVVKGVSGNLSGNVYTFNNGGENGEVILKLQNSAAETVTGVSASAAGASAANSININFAGVTNYIIDTGATSYTMSGGRIKFKIFAVDNLTNNNKMEGYSGTGTWNRVSENGSTANSSYASPGSIVFNNGFAEFEVNDSENETVVFTVTDGAITTGNITVIFQSTDTTPPEVVKVVAETPYLIHLYFSEDIRSSDSIGGARYISSYSGVGSIHTVCWYNDNVTLHLTSPLSAGAQSVTVSDIQDSANNTITSAAHSFTVSTVDYQGNATSSSDWFEIQPSVANPGPAGQVKAAVYHKNACGYLTGSNAVNAKSSVGSSATVTYSGPATGDGTVAMSDGKGTFAFSVNSTATAGQTITITVTSGSVSVSGTCTITVN